MQLIVSENSICFEKMLYFWIDIVLVEVHFGLYTRKDRNEGFYHQFISNA